MYHKANTKHNLKKRTNKYSSNKELFDSSNYIHKKNLKEVDTVKRFNTSIRIIPQPKKVKIKIENEKYCGSTNHIKRQ